MKLHPRISRNGFTLVETVIAIGVLTALLVGFAIVFAPSAQGIKNAIGVEKANRLATTLESEAMTVRPGENFATGFDKAFDWIADSNNPETPILVYQYRAQIGNLRADGTPQPLANDVSAQSSPGTDYLVVTGARKIGQNDDNLQADLDASEGAVYAVKCSQLVFSSGSMEKGNSGQIVDSASGMVISSSSDPRFRDAVIPFVAEFYPTSGKTLGYFSTAKFKDTFGSATTPQFVRNLAVRR